MFCSYRFLVCFISICYFLLPSFSSASVDKTNFADKIKTTVVPFIVNNGQTDDDVSFYAKTLGGTLFVTQYGDLVYNLPKIEVSEESNHENEKKEIKYTGGVVLKEKLVNAKVNKITGRQKAVAKVNYFKGSGTSEWHSNITTYDEISYGEVYEGIELRLKAYGDNVEKLFYVSPGADPTSIQLAFSGAEKLTVLKTGELQATTKLGDVNFTNPVAWQEIDGKRITVSVTYEVVSNDKELAYVFQVGKYDKSSTLVIDPLLASTFLGGENYDYLYAITLDSEGNVYLTGETQSPNFPKTLGAYDESFNASGASDIFISKLSSDLSTLLASTYLGGNDYENAYALTIDNSDNLYLTGRTYSTDFPFTTEADNDLNKGNGDVIVTKLSSNLGDLLSSTFLGGSKNDCGNAIIFDNSGNVYVTGYSYSTDYPTSTGAYDELFNGDSTFRDIIISKLSSDLTTLYSSTFLGGMSDETGISITLDSQDNVYVTGNSNSSDFPTTAEAFDENSNGDFDPIVSKFSSDLSTLISSTYLGGADRDGGRSILIDTKGNVFVAGGSSSTNFPTTAGAFDETHNGDHDIFISKLSSDLKTMQASTYLGGMYWDSHPSIAIDNQGDVLISGNSDSPNFPTTAIAYDQNHNGLDDIVISKLSSDLSTLKASTFLGGSADEGGRAMVLDSTDNIYVAGHSFSPDYPTTARAYDESHNSYRDGYRDVVISKLSSNLLTTTAIDTSNSKAIILAGYGDHPTNWLWEETLLNANHAFSVLVNQGYTKDNILYLNSEPFIDLDGDSKNDRDDDATLVNLESAITSWAVGADNLVLYMVGHGDRGTFIVKHTDALNEVLYARDLNDWLNTLQKNMLGRVIVVYDACFSGSFVSFLSSVYNRTILASSKSNEKSKFINNGRLSFSYQFWSVVYEGALVSDAFNHADSMMTSQTAWYDIDSDGEPNDSGDIFGNMRIGAGIKYAAATKPIITAVAPNQVLQKKGDPAQLWANVDYSGTLSEVWALLIPPDYNPSSPDTSTIELPIVPLSDSDLDKRYEADYAGFDTGGTYQVWYYAMNDNNEISEPLGNTGTVKVPSFPWAFMTPILSAGQEK